jgi:hypothetical protein
VPRAELPTAPTAPIPPPDRGTRCCGDEHVIKFTDTAADVYAYR